MIEEHVVHAAKQVPIEAYLLSKGIYPAQKLTGSIKNIWLYNSPISNEKTPSFYVSSENTFRDFSSGQKGDIIRLVRLLDQCDFVSAVKTLLAFDTSRINIESITGTEEQRSINTGAFIVSVRSLQHWKLIQYVESRKIPFPLAQQFLKQVHYKNDEKGKEYFGVGWQTEKGSYAIRSEKIRKWIGPASPTVVPGINPDRLNLFEGYFDFLSALVYFRVKQMQNTTIILNSNANLPQCLPRLQESSMVYTFLDNDGSGNNGGLQAMERLRKEKVPLINRSGIYKGFKDFNEYLQSQ